MYFLSIILFCFLFLQIFGRPTHVLQDYDKDSKDNLYRDDSANTDDYHHDEQKSSLKQFAGIEHGPKAELLEENRPRANEEVYRARPDKDYLENDEDQGDAAHFTHDDISINSGVKRTAAYSNGIPLFHDNEKPRKVETKEYSEDNRDSQSQHARYIKQYNTMHNEERDSLSRDRRQIKNNYLNEPIGTDEISTQINELRGNEDEETAIRTHVKKLSKDELDELLHSLTEDKRALLKNIIENSQEYDSINKREITKKSGANEENSFVGSEQSDTSKILVGSANLEAESSMTPNLEKQDNTKKAEDSMYSKSPEIGNSSEKTNDKINVLESIVEKTPVKSDNIENLEASEAESKILGNPDSNKETLKKENKREIDPKSFVQSEPEIEEPEILKSSNKDDLYCSDNEVLSQLWHEDGDLYNDNKYKREACSDEIDSIKSLEDSFPNIYSSNNFKSESDMAPLVRVKRTNPDKVIQKRDAHIVSNLKVPYFSSELENNEEGSDEGGEFQDDGFFDRGANFAKSDEFKRGMDTSKGNEESNIKHCGNSPPVHIDKNKLDTDSVGLGSDTDVVVSGIEGVDDNMMYNGVARIRRTGDSFDNLNMEGESSKFRQENRQQLQLQNEDNEISEEYNNAARYQENDAFGSLPRNYEQDLGRFKRIRRLKPNNNVPTVK